MGFWNKLGKIALTAAPYIAAPFTGGASLLLAPATQAAERKWAEHDANEAISKGIAPSSFDKYLGMAGDVASMVAPTGAFGALGKVASTAGKVGGIAANVGKAATIANAGLGTAGIIGNAIQSRNQNQNQNQPMGNDLPSSGGFGRQMQQGIPFGQPSSQMSQMSQMSGIGPSPNVMNQANQGQQFNPYNSSVGQALMMGRQSAMNPRYR